jgi:hypothetical protein
MSKEQEKQLAGELFGRGEVQKPMGALEAVKEAFQAVAPGLSLDKIMGDVGHELKQQVAFGAHELAAALFNGSGFIMYPRGSRDDHGKDGHGVHGPEQGLGEQSFVEKLHQEGQQQERGGREI